MTVGLASAGKVKVARAILYIIAQCAGAAAGSGLLKALTPERAAGKLGVTALGTDVSSLQGFGIEFFLGFVLIFVVCGVSYMFYIVLSLIDLSSLNQLRDLMDDITFLLVVKKGHPRTSSKQKYGNTRDVEVHVLFLDLLERCSHT